MKHPLSDYRTQPKQSLPKDGCNVRRHEQTTRIFNSARVMLLEQPEPTNKGIKLWLNI
ncbi:MAG: hypothetical protein V7711_16665 [Pseudomonadales bacterium]